jgi:hypothetical protein
MDLDKKAGGLYTAKRSADLDIQAEVFEAWAGLRNDGDFAQTSWIALTIDAAKKVVVYGQGSGDLTELLSKISDDDIYFGGLRVKTTSGSVKFLQFYFVGANVGGMKKGKASLWKNAIFNALEGSHGSLEVPNGLDGAADDFARQVGALAGGGGWTLGR